MRRVAAALLLGVLCSACGVSDAVTPAGASSPPAIVVQGAMDVEVQTLVAALDGARQEQFAGWTFWSGKVDGYPVVIFKTRRGMSHASAATAIAVEHFHPAAIINQGTAGGHQADLHVYDIVIGKESVNLGAFRTPVPRAGTGQQPADWGPIDLRPVRRERHAAAGTRRRFTAFLLTKACSPRRSAFAIVIRRAASSKASSDRATPGTASSIASSGFTTQFGTSVEEMETASAAQIAGAFHVPFLGIRVVSNNITNDGAYDNANGGGLPEIRPRRRQAVHQGIVTALRRSDHDTLAIRSSTNTEA